MVRDSVFPLDPHQIYKRCPILPNGNRIKDINRPLPHFNVHLRRRNSTHKGMVVELGCYGSPTTVGVVLDVDDSPGPRESRV